MLTSDEARGRFVTTRRLTETLAGPLSPEDQTVQSMPDVSPTKWHRAHVTWFFETFVLERFVDGYQPYDPDFRTLFNSYYEGVGPQFTRSRRGLLSRPGAAEVGKYRDAVDAAVDDVLASSDDREMLGLVELGLHHEQQHQELLLMDIKHVLSVDPRGPTYRPDLTEPTSTPELTWTDVDPGGVVEVGIDTEYGGDTFHFDTEYGGDTFHFDTGYRGDTFHFDNESPRHRVHLEPFRLADRLVTAGEWCDFIDDGGYDRPDLWLSDGWHTVREQGWSAPLYWRRDGGEWLVHTLGGVRPIVDGEPVCHVSHYEADAYARWAGARLPTEFEWEHAAVAAGRTPEHDRAFDLDALQPRPSVRSGGRLTQLFGECWQWTASAYLPYPGFTPAPGAVGEYNGKFMSGQMVLRGSSASTPPGHARTTYRNFFPPHARWMVSGVRLADGGAA